MHPLRIFLSSPGDVAEEREVARDVIEQVASCHFVRGKVAVQIVAWDDRHASAPMDSRETPQLSVNRYTGLPADCDLTVVILWSRIGTPMPPDLKRADGSPVESGTVWEYENALQANKPVFVYRKTAIPQITLDDPLLDEKRGQYDQVKCFFEGFRNPDGSLRTGVNNIASAANFSILFRQHLEAFLKPYLEQIPASVTVPAFRWPAPWDYSAYMTEKRRGFVGREWLFGEIRAWLSNPASRALLIRADYGVGKTAFLSELVARNHDGAIVGWHFCQHDTRETLRAGNFVRSLAAQLRASLPSYRKHVEALPELQECLDRALDDPGSAFEAAVINPLAALPPEPAARLILIDALDEALEIHSEDAKRAGTLVSLLANKVRRLPSWLRLVVTSRNNPEVIHQLDGAFVLTQIDAEGGNNQDDLYAFVRHRATGDSIATKLATSGKSADWLATLLINNAGGKFLYAARALRDLSDCRITVDQAQQLPPGMGGFYQNAFERRFDCAGRDYEPYRAMLGMLCVLREPVSPLFLSEVLGCSVSDVKQVRALLPDFIVQRHGGYTYEHLSITEWLSQEDEDGFARAGRYGIALDSTEYIVRGWATKRVADGTAHRFDYIVRHLAAHLPNDDERRRIFAKQMLDYRWLKARLALDGVDALISDCRHLGDGEEARLMKACLHNAAHILRRNPEQLAAQLIGRLKDRISVNGIAEICNSTRTEITREVRELKRVAALLPSTASLLLDIRLLAVLEGHGNDTVVALTEMPDGRLASAGDDRTIRLWDLAGSDAPHILDVHDLGYVQELEALPDGRLASLIGSRVYLWDLMGCEASKVLVDFDDADDEGNVEFLKLLPDGCLLIGNYNNSFCRWDPVCSRFGKLPEGWHFWLDCPLTLPDGRFAFIEDGTICLAAPSSDVETQVLKGYEGWVTALAVLRSGHLVSGDSDGKIRLWDPSCIVATHGLDGEGRKLMALTALPNECLVLGYNDGTISLGGIHKASETQLLEGHRGSLSSLAMMPDGRLGSGGNNRTVRIWDLNNSGMVTTLVFLPEDDDCTSRIWDLMDKWNFTESETPWDSVDICTLVDNEFALDNSDLWKLKGCGSVQLFNDGREITALVALPDGRVAANGCDGTIRLWDLTGRDVPQILRGHRGEVSALAVLLDGRLVSGGDDGTIRLWELTSTKEPQVLEGHGARVGAFTVLPDGRLVAAMGHKVLVWHPGFEQVSAEFEADAAIVGLVSLPSGRIVAGDASSRLHFLDLIEY